MARGLGLQDALQGYQQGVAWRQQQDALETERAAAEKRRATREAANSAFASSLDADKAKWALGGAQGDYVPDDNAYLRAAHARAASFAKAGDYDSYMENAARLAPIIGGMRQRALDQYGDDEVGLAKAVYGTFLDGKDLTSADMVDGTGPDGKPTGKRVRLVLSDGTTSFLDPGTIRKKVERSVMSPEWKMKEADHLWNMQRIVATGDQNRQTEGVKLQGGLTLADRKGEIDRGLEEVRQAGRLGLADVENNYRMGQIGASGAEARKTKSTPGYDDRNFTLGEGQTRFTLGLDGKPVPVAAGTPKAARASNDLKDIKDLMGILANSGMSKTKDLMSGGYSPDQITQRASQRVRQFVGTGMSVDDAIAAVQKELDEQGVLK